ncbi:hypothetical protein [Paenibacillus luteus]|uniref:hypothetical protein n=1 Tax=Paenibacillus luteus TaxID=2545753 RepID=UPI0011450919|nr:hypothetical protein [Paenibacillus luteus]
MLEKASTLARGTETKLAVGLSDMYNKRGRRDKRVWLAQTVSGTQRVEGVDETGEEVSFVLRSQYLSYPCLTTLFFLGHEATSFTELPSLSHEWI